MFMAVAYGRDDGGSASLDALIGTADWINHAVPLDEELQLGLNRLIAAGFISESEDRFRLTEAGEALHAKSQKRAGLWKQFERLEVQFDVLADPPDPAWKPSHAALDDARAAYHKRMAAAIRSLPKRRAR
jgi:hypothetical protein